MDDKKKKPGHREDEKDHRNTQHGAGHNSSKTRPDVPSTHANKVATGKQT